MRSFLYPAAVIAAVASVAAPAAKPVASARDLLARAAFDTRDKAQALALINAAIQQTQAASTQTPSDRDARLQHAVALGYRGHLNQSVGDAKAARVELEALARANPRDPDILVSLAGWHLTVVSDVGGFVGRTMLGASRDTGLQTLDKAVALGGNRAFFPAYAGLMRLSLDPKDIRAASALLDRASGAAAPTAVDRTVQASAQRISALIRAGDNAGAAALAKRLVPFGTTA